MNSALQHLQQSYDGQAQGGYREPRPPFANDQHLDPALTAGNHDSPHPHHNQLGLEELQQTTEATNPSQLNDTQQQQQQQQQHHQNDTSTQPPDPSTPGPSTDKTALQDLGQPIHATFSDLEDLITHLQTFAKDHGFALVRSTLRRRESDKVPILLNLLCDRHGHLRNHRRLTEETRVRKKRKSRGIGCPYRISCTLRQVKNEMVKVDEGGQQQRAPVAVMQSQAATDGGNMEGVESGTDPAIDPSLQDAATSPSAHPLQQQQQEQPAPSVLAPPAPNNINPLASSAPHPTSTEIWTFKVTSPSHNHSSTTALSTPGTTPSTTTTITPAESKTTTSPTNNSDTPTTPSSHRKNKTPKSAAPPETHWKHRRITPTDMKRIRQWYINGKSPREMFDLIKADSPGCLYTLKDLQNARRRAKVQFEEFLEGKNGGTGAAGGA